MDKPPYVEIWDGIEAREVVPLLGSGASRALGKPDEPWDFQSSEFLPSGVELARYLAKHINFPAPFTRRQK
jgi:hypothetical protein